MHHSKMCCPLSELGRPLQKWGVRMMSAQQATSDMKWLPVALVVALQPREGLLAHAMQLPANKNRHKAWPLFMNGVADDQAAMVTNRRWVIAYVIAGTLFAIGAEAVVWWPVVKAGVKEGVRLALWVGSAMHTASPASVS